jgi:hypothetical protein
MVETGVEDSCRGRQGLGKSSKMGRCMLLMTVGFFHLKNPIVLE